MDVSGPKEDYWVGSFADLGQKASAMLGSGAEVVKLSVMAHRLSDNLVLRNLGRHTRVPVVLVGMGMAGVPSRVLATWMGSAWTYSGDGVAPGQVPPQRMIEEFRFRHITARTSVISKPSGSACFSSRHWRTWRKTVSMCSCSAWMTSFCPS